MSSSGSSSGLLKSHLVLPLIVDVLSVHEIGRLWFCGDTNLNHLLAPAVRTFRLEYVQNERLKDSLVWPKLISHFVNLQDLKVAAPPHLSRFSIVREVDFASIPPSIRHLSLQFANACLEAAFATGSLPNQSPAPSPFREHFQHLETLEISNYMLDLSPNFAQQIFSPSLTRLRLPNSVKLREEDVNALPRSLTHLAFTFEREGDETFEKLDFPPNLTHLEVELAPTALMLPKLPSSLKYLHICPGSDCLKGAGDISLIPKELVSLSSPALTFDAAACKALPQTLTHANLDAKIASDIRNPNGFENPLLYLPPNLQVLDGLHAAYTSSVRWADIITELIGSKETVFALPRTLRRLPFTSPAHAAETMSQFPRTLESLAFPEMSGITAPQERLHIYSQLPPSLTHLSQVSIPEHEIGLLSGLTRLTRMSLTGTFSMRLWNTLSSIPTLKYLSINVEKRSFELWDPTPGSGAEDKLDGPKLTSLVFHGRVSPTELKFNASRSWYAELRALKFVSAVAGKESVKNWFSTLPPSLTILDLQGIISDSNIPMEYLEALPRQLVSLTLKQIEFKNNPTCLPPSLTNLDLTVENSNDITIEDVVNTLPPLLASVSIRSEKFGDNRPSVDMTPLFNKLRFLRGTNIAFAPFTIPYEPKELFPPAIKKGEIDYWISPTPSLSDREVLDLEA